MVVFLIIMIISSYYLIKEYIEYKKCTELITDIIEDNISEENEINDIKIDWEGLEEINKNVIGWIRIDDTNINYPILKDDDNLTYLTHTFDNNYNKNGSIFTLNSKPFEEKITNIYGHNMKSGLMFSNLKKYMNKNFLLEHQNFEIYTKNQDYRAIVFSCYSTGVYQEKEAIKNLNFDEEIEYYKKSSICKIENIEGIEKIVKLSTCSYINNHSNPTNQRYYVVAKLEKIS